MTSLPASSTALVEDRKVRDYLLNAEHSDNGGKAALFQAFGFSRGAWSIFQIALRRHAVENQVVSTEVTRFGTMFEIACNLHTPDGRNPCLRTIWIAEDGAPPRLVTAYR